MFLTMYPSTNTRSGSTSSNETLDISPPTYTTSPYLSKYDLNNNHNDIKAVNDKHNSDMKTLNNRISAMITKLTDTSSNTYKQEKQPKDISSKLSTYEGRL